MRLLADEVQRVARAELEARARDGERVLFASDEPWSDFWGEYWKIAGADVGQELKDRVLHGNFEELYGTG